MWELLREQTNVTVIHEYISERLWRWREIPKEERKHHSCLQEGQEGGYTGWQMKQPQLKPWESSGETSPGNSFQTHEGQGDYKQAARICNAWPPCKEITGSAHGGRTADAFYPDLYKTSSTAFHNLLMDKLKKYRLQKWPVRWAEYWLSFGAGRALVNGTKSSWRPATSGLWAAAFNTFIVI